MTEDLDLLLVAARPEAPKLKRKATVHFSKEEKELDKLKKGQKGAAPEKDTSVIFGPVRTVTLKNLYC